MRKSFLRAAAVLALLASSTTALAETPARVGRLSLVQGPVSISAEDGEGDSDALVNWPVTSENRIVTERGARTEIRIGSTAVRLDGDSSLDVVELDDDRLRLQLNYGSASVRIRNPEVLAGFEIGTPQGRVTMREPGRIRVDSWRARDTTTVDVFEGVAVVDGDGSRLSVRVGRRAEMRPGDLGTAFAVRTSFDDWGLLRDRQDDRVTSDRYVTSEMTGYEDLDRYGSWHQSSEYGPLWLPRGVSAGWAPYRDGRWTWVAPWGWTWIDNAPWGYAPFHYGRWVMVNNRWSWAPGRNIGRPVWAPALVGWVGGSGWSLSFSTGSHRTSPAQGWYPLGPGDRFVPGYRTSHDHLRYHNRHARNDGDRRRGDHHRRQGLTVVPHEHFNRRVPIVVPQAPRAVVTPLALQAVPAAAPPAPRQLPRERVQRRFSEEQQQDGGYRDRERRALPTVAPAPAPSPAPVVVPAPAPVQPAAVIQAQPAVVAQEPRREWNHDQRREERLQGRAEVDAQLRAEQLQRRQWQNAHAEQEQRRQWQNARDERRMQMEEMRRARQPQQAPVAIQQPAPQAAPQMAPRQMAAPMAMPAPAPAMAPAPAPAQREPDAMREHRRQQADARRENRRQGVNTNLE